MSKSLRGDLKKAEAAAAKAQKQVVKKGDAHQPALDAAAEVSRKPAVSIDELLLLLLLSRPGSVLLECANAYMSWHSTFWGTSVAIASQRPWCVRSFSPDCKRFNPNSRKLTVVGC